MSSIAVWVTLVVVVAASVLAVQQPLVGLLTYLWLDFMRPHDSFVAIRAFRPMLIVSLVTIAATVWQQRRQLLHRWPRLLPVLALAAAVALSTIHSSDPATSAAALLQVLKMLALVWLMSALVTTDARFQATLWVIALSLLALAIGAVVQGVEHGLMREFRVELVVEGPPGNSDGAFRDNNDLARVLALSVPLWWALASRMGPVWTRIVAAAGCVTSVAGIVFTFSRGGFIALVAAVVVVSCFYRPWWRAFMIPPLFTALLLVLAPRPYLDRVLTITRPAQEGSLQGRVEIWKGSLEIARKDPVLGQGAGTLRVGAARRTSHNVFVQVLAETGMVGMAAYIWLLLATFGALHRARRSAVGISHAADLRTASVGLEAALFGYLTAGLTLSEPLQSPLFALIGLTLALQRPVEATEAIGSAQTREVQQPAAS